MLAGGALVALVAGSIGAAQVRQDRSVKILGQPAASEWIDLASGQFGQSTTYQVPRGQILTVTGAVV